MNINDVAGVIADSGAAVVAKALAKAPRDVLAAQLIESLEASTDDDRVYSFVRATDASEIDEASTTDLAELLAHVLDGMDRDARIAAVVRVLEATSE